MKRLIKGSLLIPFLSLPSLNAEVKWNKLPNKTNNQILKQELFEPLEIRTVPIQSIKEKNPEPSPKDNSGVEKSMPFNKKETSHKPLQWERLEKKSNSATDAKVKWINRSKKSNQFPIKEENPYPENYNESLRILEKLYYEQELGSGLFNIGDAVPTANLLNENSMQVSINQISSFGNGESSGTGNQNYLGNLRLGLTNEITIGGFYTESDDPLINNIKSLSNQPANRWANYGAALRFQIYRKEKFKIAFEGSMEKWDVKSGGCNSFIAGGCTSESPNIFNNNIDPVRNNNLIGSISFPLTWILSDSIEFSLSPKFVFLPDEQSNENGSGEFYGNNFGLGIGIAYKPISQFKTFGSAFFPFGPGNNSFNEDLEFSKKPILTGGINYSLNPRIALEGYLSNGFGSSPSTGILTIPSDNQILYGGRLIYTPTNLDSPPIARDEQMEKRSFGGLSVSNANLIDSGQQKLRASFSGNGSWVAKMDLGFSQLFSFDLATGIVGSSLKPKSSLGRKYLDPGSKMIRGGGTAIFFSQPRGDAITSGLRMSYGRVLGDTRPGYLFTELVNSYELNNRLSININPKMAWSASGTPRGIGASLNWDISNLITFIPEFNFSLAEGESNSTFAIRINPYDNTFLDFYTTNSLSFMDMGQLLKSKDQAFGINLGTTF